MKKEFKHKIAFLKDRNIPFKILPFGLQINRDYYDYNLFKYFDITFIDTTFIINI